MLVEFINQSMNRIIESVENDDPNYLSEIQMQNRHNKSPTDAIIAAADTISRNAQAAVIVTFSVSGGTTFRMARERCPVRVVGISPSIHTRSTSHRVVQLCIQNY